MDRTILDTQRLLAGEYRSSLPLGPHADSALVEGPGETAFSSAVTPKPDFAYFDIGLKANITDFVPSPPSILAANAPSEFLR